MVRGATLVVMSVTQKPKTTRARAKRGRVGLEQHVKSRIHDGTWPPGYQLPTERELAEVFGMARNTLRKALAGLEQEGVIERHVGRGTFVAQPAPTTNSVETTSAEALLARIHGASPIDVMDLRLVLEPPFIEAATMRATSRDRQQIAHCIQKSEKATGVLEFEHWDGAFHHAILAATHNQLLVDLYEAINGVRRQPEWEIMKSRSLTAEVLASYRKQHRRLFRAVMDRDAATARDAAREHLISVRESLIGTP
jgi:GntR family transcriptional regulator, transcriptional repressor for pyruvate dehydrogenase complex